MTRPAEDLPNGWKKIDGHVVILTATPMMRAGALRIVESAIEGVDYEIFTLRPPTLDQVVLVLRQTAIQRGRMPVELLEGLQAYYMRWGELPPNRDLLWRTSG